MSMTDVQLTLRNYTFSGFPIVADQHRLVGFITRQDLENGLIQSQKHYGESIQESGLLYYRPIEIQNKAQNFL